MNNKKYEEFALLRKLGVKKQQIKKDLSLSEYQYVYLLNLDRYSNMDDFLTDISFKCKKCGEERVYKNKLRKDYAQGCGRNCKKCRSKDCKEKFKGKGNPFFGKKHSKELIERFSSERKGVPLSEERKKESLTYLNKYLKDNPRKHPYQHWLIKFGKEIADQKMEELREKNREASTGEKNPMYGKPTPKKAGSGWSGWYNDSFYFRSIRELSFFISAEDSGFDIKSIHLTKEFKVPYKGTKEQNRTYSPDFVMGNEIIEIKPKRLWSTDENKRKFSAAKTFFERKGYVFVVKDVEPDTNLLREKYLEGKIKFDKKCIEKFEKYCGISKI